MRGLKILSLCGGVETGIVSLQKLGIPIEEYHEEAIFELLSEQYYHLMYYAYSDIHSEDMYYCNKMKRRYSEYL